MGMVSEVDVLGLIYGNNPRSVRLKPKAERLLDALKGGDDKSRDELMLILELDPKSSKDLAHFYTVLRPLSRAGLVVHALRGKGASYRVSMEGFGLWLRGLESEAAARWGMKAGQFSGRGQKPTT